MFNQGFIRGRGNGARTGVGIAAAACALFLALPSSAGWERHEVDGGPPASVLSVAIGDADNDGDAEVVTGGNGSGLRIYDGEESSWTYQEIVGGLNANSVAVSDADNDGDQEVICGTDGRKVLLYEYTGSAWTERTVDSNVGSKVLSVYCGDADNDQMNEIVVGTQGKDVYLYEGSGESWSRTEVDGNAGNQVLTVAVADADGDGENEIVCGTQKNDIFIYEKDGGSWVRSAVDEDAGAKVVCIDIGDSDGDGEPEIVAGTDGDALCQYEWNGSSWSKESIDSAAGGDVRGARVCDPDGDGTNEVSVIVQNTGVTANKLLLYEKGPSGWHRTEVDSQVDGQVTALAVADADDDCKTELVVGTSVVENVFIYEEFVFLSLVMLAGTGDMTASWAGGSGLTYEVYYSGQPDTGFTYVTDVVASGDTTEWVDDGTDTGVHPKDVTARYYRIKLSGTDTFSNTVGKFTRAFGTEMHLTSIPLVPYSNSIQDVIGTQLTGAPDEAYADRVWKWDRELQAFMFAWLVDSVSPEYNGTWWCPEPFGPSDMTLDFGEGFFVQTRHDNQKVTFVGAVPEGVVSPVEVRPGMQLVGTAWPETLVLDSCDFYASGAKGAADELLADRVWQWDESGLFYRYCWLVDGVGPQYDAKWWSSDPWGPSDMRTMPGYGYWYQARGNGFRWKFWK